MRRLLFLVIFGLGGAAILISLGIWQMQRLAWKEGVIADIDARILATPVTLPATPDPVTDAYLPVRITGRLGESYLRVLVSQKRIGAGYRIISPLETPQGAVLVDRGFIKTDMPVPPAPQGNVTVIGNLQWPQETDSYTPAPDRVDNIWFARDVAVMAQDLKTQPILVVAANGSFPDGSVTPLPVDTSRIPNDHLQYAVTWFSLAAIWILMTAFFLRRPAGPALKD